MEDSLYFEIISASEEVDERFLNISDDDLLKFKTSFIIPESHSRSNKLSTYSFNVGSLSSVFSGRKTLVFIDQSLKSLDWVTNEIPVGTIIHFEVPSEHSKEKNRLDSLIIDDKLKEKDIEEIVAIGGGVVINTASYIAEQLGCDLVYVPTTVLAMADAAIGGKVRANIIENTVCHKHAYKSFYEPNSVIIDPRFLTGLPERQISIGLGEILKHGVYQSPALLEYLASDIFNPFQDRTALLKSILWTVDLSAACLNVDPEETIGGSHIIMRGAHDASDKIEEASGFTVPHGTAVAMAIHAELLATKSKILPLFECCLAKFNIPND